MKKKPKNIKLQKKYIIRKYIFATSVKHAIKIEKKYLPDDVWIDDEWKKENPNSLVSAIGFEASGSEH
jgi:hypothetical protein